MNPKNERGALAMSSEWVAAIAAIWAAFATTWAAVATSRAIAVTRKAPIDAAQVAASLQDASERRRLKLWVFATIMQNRQFLAEADSVRALNLIDTVFHDVPPVRDAWANFFAALNDQRNFPPTGPTPVIDERRTTLLAGMARDLGLVEDFRPDDFTRVYLPQTALAEMQIRTLQRTAALNALSGQPATPDKPALFCAAAALVISTSTTSAELNL
jgi:hypothetical protein